MMKAFLLKNLGKKLKSLYLYNKNMAIKVYCNVYCRNCFVSSKKSLMKTRQMVRTMQDVMKLKPQH